MLGEYDVLLLCRLAMNKIKNIAAFFFFAYLCKAYFWISINQVALYIHLLYIFQSFLYLMPYFLGKIVYIGKSCHLTEEH